MLTAPKPEWSNPDLKCRCCGAPAVKDDPLTGGAENTIAMAGGTYRYTCGAQIRRVGIADGAFHGEIVCPNATSNREK